MKRQKLIIKHVEPDRDFQGKGTEYEKALGHEGAWALKGLGFRE